MVSFARKQTRAGVATEVDRDKLLRGQVAKGVQLVLTHRSGSGIGRGCRRAGQDERTDYNAPCPPPTSLRCFGQLPNYSEATTSGATSQWGEKTFVSTNHLANRRVGAELARYVRTQAGHGGLPVTALQAVVADLSATSPNLATPLREVVSRQVFQPLIPLAGSGRGELQLKALIEDICQLYHPDVVQSLVEVLNGFLELDEGRVRQKVETEREKPIPLASQNTKKEAKRGIWKPSTRSLGITGMALGVLAMARILISWQGEEAGTLRTLPTKQHQAVDVTANPVSPVATTYPLTVAEPSEAQLRDLLEAWLEGKSRLLGDSTLLPPPSQSVHPLLSDLARSNLVDNLQRHREKNDMAGITETVNISVERFKVIKRSPSYVAAQVTLRYSDEQKDRNRKVLSRTPSTVIANNYVFARDDGRWLVAAFKSD